MFELFAYFVFTICFFIAFFGIEWVEAIINFFMGIYEWVKDFFQK